jgi:hypothetical protein
MPMRLSCALPPLLTRCLWHAMRLPLCVSAVPTHRDARDHANTTLWLA